MTRSQTSIQENRFDLGDEPFPSIGGDPDLAPLEVEDDPKEFLSLIHILTLPTILRV